MKRFILLFFISLSFLTFSQENQPKIVVQGTGTIKTVPDRVVINFTVVTSDENPLIASETNKKIMVRVEETLVKLKIPKENLTTLGYTVVKEKSEKDEPAGKTEKYFVRNNLSLNFDDIDRIGQIISSLEEAGVNLIQGLNFYSSKSELLENEVLVKAYKNAFEKAQAIAKTAGYTIKPLEIVSDSFAPRVMFTENTSVNSTASVQIYAPQTLNFIGNLRVTFLMEKEAK